MADDQFTPEDRAHLSIVLWPKVALSAPTSCWPWIGKRDPGGYGRVNLPFGSTGAHRAVFALWNNSPLSRDEVVMHICDNPCCCNPHHLLAGSQADNIADRVAKGRSALGRKPNPKVGKNPPTRDPQELTISPRSERTTSEILADLMQQKRLKRQALKAHL